MEQEVSLQPVDTDPNYEPDESIPLNLTPYKVRSDVYWTVHHCHN